MTAPEEYAVISSVISHGLNNANQKVVIIAETAMPPAPTTASSEASTALAERLEIPLEAIQDWQDRNRQRSRILPAFTLKQPYEILNPEQHRVLFKGPDPEAAWTRFKRRYPNAPGVLRVSRVGFANNDSNAVVYIEYYCGAECGSARLVHLARLSDAQWRVLTGELVWIIGPEPASKRVDP